MRSMAGGEELLLKREEALRMHASGAPYPEIAERLGMSRSWVYKYCKKGRAEVGWTQEEIDRMAAMRRRGAHWDVIAARLNRNVNSCRIKWCRVSRMDDPKLRRILSMLVWAREKSGCTDAGKLIVACHKADLYGRMEWDRLGQTGAKEAKRHEAAAPEDGRVGNILR